MPELYHHDDAITQCRGMHAWWLIQSSILCCCVPCGWFHRGLARVLCVCAARNFTGCSCFVSCGWVSSRSAITVPCNLCNLSEPAAPYCLLRRFCTVPSLYFMDARACRMHVCPIVRTLNAFPVLTCIYICICLPAALLKAW